MQQADARDRRALVGRTAGLALVVVLLAAGLGALVGRVALPGAEAAPSAVAPASPRAVVLLTGGAVQVAADDLDVLEAEARVEVLPETGFAVGATPLGRAVLRYLPDPDLDLVVVQGGEADAGAPLPEGNVEVAALHLVDRVRAGAGPRTSVVLVGPVPEPTGPTPALVAVRDELQAAAVARGVPFLDPVALGWSSADDVGALLAAALVPLVPAGA